MTRHTHRETRQSTSRRPPLTRTPPSVPGRFVVDVIDRTAEEHSDAAAAAIEAALPGHPPPHISGRAEAERYYALCERAWLHWSRVALDHITAHSLHQTTVGAFTPTTGP